MKHQKKGLTMLLMIVLGVLFSTFSIMAAVENDEEIAEKVGFILVSEPDEKDMQRVMIKLESDLENIIQSELQYQVAGETRYQISTNKDEEFLYFQVPKLGENYSFLLLTITTDLGEEVIELSSNSDTNEEIGVYSTQIFDKVGSKEVIDNGKYIVVIDAGHGGAAPGAVNSLDGITYLEKDINLKIAQYVKEELEKNYPNIEVHMTRDTDVDVALKDRAEFAAEKNAHLFISMHVNSFTTSSPKGVRAYVPNKSSFNKYTNVQGTLLAKGILDELSSLGFVKGDCFTSNSSDDKYADGYAADYYGVIKHSRRLGITGIIVEHGFITNPEDLAFLAVDENIRKIAVADAKAIAGYFERNGKDLITAMKGETTPPKIEEGWKKINQKWYYVTKSGAYYKGWLKVAGKWYYLDQDGVMKSGWIKEKNKWYYLEGSGVMKTGWLKDKNKWYFLDSSGVMKTGWLKQNNIWYYLESGGAMKTGWVKVSNKWYYCGGNGAMKTGWLKDNGKWYFLDGGGVMKTGWIKVKNSWYYLYNNGVMAQNTWIGNYHINANGVWI